MTTKQRVLEWQRRFRAADERAGLSSGTTAQYTLALARRLPLPAWLKRHERFQDAMTGAAIGVMLPRGESEPLTEDEVAYGMEVARRWAANVIVSPERTPGRGPTNISERPMRPRRGDDD